MQPVVFSGCEVICSRTRGDAREYVGAADQQRDSSRAAAHRDVHCAEEWTQMEARLEKFAAATPEIIAGPAFAAEGVGWEVGVRGG